MESEANGKIVAKLNQSIWNRQTILDEVKESPRACTNRLKRCPSFQNGG